MADAKEAEVNLQEVHDFLVDLAARAGEMILAAEAPGVEGAGEKKNSADLVTATDRAVEQMLLSSLSATYPAFSFIGEETHSSTSATATSLGPEPTFIVDPIDGTTNFVHGYPYVCVSLGLAVGTRPVVGVVFNPYTGQMYSAVKGQGAWLNGKTRLPLRKGAQTQKLELRRALVAVEWGSERKGNDFRVKRESFARLCAEREEEEGKGGMVHGVRSFGSAALNLCGVASGSLDAYWEAGCWAWDVCAGWVVLEEAGGKMVGGNPGEWEASVEGRRYLAVRAGVGQDEFIEEFWGCVVGRFEVGP